MASDFFDFKEFRVFHKLSAMKVGTDSVLLGCLVNIFASDKHVLDIGTGCGILALIMAQRGEAEIDAIEIDELAFQEASANFSNSIWATRLQAKNISIQLFAQETQIKYDCIVSNPPYFDSARNFNIEDEQRKLARQDANLPFEDLALSVAKLLNEAGSFWLVLPPHEASNFQTIAARQGLFLNFDFSIYPNAESLIRRKVQAYGKIQNALIEEDLVLLNKDKEKTSSYFNLTKDFYLDQQKSR